MKKIKMLKGGYGLAEKSGRIQLKTADDEAFDAPDKDAQMLVDQGYAEFVGKTRKKATPKPVEEPKVEEESEIEPQAEAETEEETTVDYSSMTLKDLKKVADDLDIDYDSKIKKDDLIALIEEATPPSFDPVEVEE